MAVQNMYNNYIKRQQKQPMNQFRQKVANSLTGKSVGNNTTTNKTPAMMGNTSVNTLGATTQPKPKQNSARTVTQPTTQTTPQATTTPLQTHSISEGIFTQPTQQNALESNIQAQNTTSVPQTTATETEPVQGVGMMSLSDINNAIKGDVDTEEPTTELTQQDVVQINELAHNPQVVRMARATNKTPQQMAQELIETQKKQLKEQWEQQKKELELQKNQLNESYEQSKKDAESSYKDTEKTLQENRYKQQEDLAVSGQKRGIQYSPQQLALENVANINMNKSLAEASTKRNELLNQLAIQLGQSLANVNMGLQNASVEYNTNVSQLMADYQKQMMDWAYNDQQTEADRKWQEEQTKADQAFQKEMAELQNKWQAEQNALDRKTYGSGRSGGSGYSYSRSYYPRSSYKGYARSAYGNWGNYSMSNDLDLSTETGSEAFGNTVEEYSTDLYNALDVGGLYDVNDRGKIYIDEIDQYLDYAKQNGASKAVIDELERTRKYAVKNLFDKSYARSTNTAVQVGDTVYKSTTPLSKHYINKNKATKQLNRAKYESVVARTEKEKKQAKTNESFFKSTGQGRTLNDLHEFAKKKAQSNKSTSKSTKTDKKTAKAPYKPISKQTTAQAKNTAKKTVQSSTMSKLNTIKKNTTTSKSSTKKKVTKTSTKSKFKKSLSNLKKNIKKLFKW